MRPRTLHLLQSLFSFVIFLASVALVVLLVHTTVTASEAEDKGAVYELLKTDIKIDGNRFAYTVHARLNILNARGDEYAEFYATEGRWSKLKDLDITVSRSNGQEIYTRDKKDLTRVCGFGGYTLYTDICHLTTELKAPTYPYIIEYSYTIEHESLFELHSAPLQRSIPIDSVEVTLAMKQDDPIQWKVTGLDLEPTVETNGDKRLYRWQAYDQPGLNDIEYVPDAYDDPARVRFMAHQFKLEKYQFDGGSWQQVGAFYNQLADDRYLLVDSPTPLLDTKTQHDSLKSIYESVINSTRYVAIEIGIGGWQPYAAELTQSRGYGDCKDLTTLLISRLRKAGVQAHPALLNTRGNGLTDPDFPSLSFNHVITAAVIDRDTIWLDPTCGTCPMGEIPYGDEDINLLLISDSGGVLVRTPAQLPSDNLEKRTTDIYIAENGRIEFSTRLEITGELALRLRYRIPHLTTDQANIFYRDLFSDSKRKFAIETYEVENLDDINQPLIIKLTGICSRPADLIKNQIFCRTAFLDQPGSFENTVMKERTKPIKLYYPRRLEHQINVTWSNELPVGSVIPPPDSSYTCLFGSLAISSVADSSSVQITYEKEYAAYEVSIGQLGEFGLFQKCLKKLADCYVTLELGP